MSDATSGMPSGNNAIAVYEISVTKEGVTVQPDNIAKTKIPCENNEAKVFRKEADGSFIDMKSVYSNGYLEFYTDICGVFIVAEEKSYLCGDTNLDGRITIEDVTAIQRHLAERELFTDEQLALADINGDGEINITDATHLQKYLAEFDGIVLGKQPIA